MRVWYASSKTARPAYELRGTPAGGMLPAGCALGGVPSHATKERTS